MMTIMIGKMEMVLPDMYMMKRFIGTCQITKTQIEIQFLLTSLLSIIASESVNKNSLLNTRYEPGSESLKTSCRMIRIWTLRFISS
jgi:hypothetical protein